MQQSIEAYSRSGALAIGLFTFAVSAVFLGLIWNFLMALFLAATFSALASPLYSWIFHYTGERPRLSASITLVLLAVAVLIPALMILDTVIKQGSTIVTTVLPAIERQVAQRHDLFTSLPEDLPFRDEIVEYGPGVLAKIGELSRELGRFVLNMLTSVSKSTVRLVFGLFIFLYAMFFFLQDRGTVLNYAMKFTLMPAETQTRVVNRTVSVCRATIKGSLLIGLVQGVLGGVGFSVAGISGAAFWGTVMAILSVIPGVGTALVWVPGVIYLFINGETGWAVALLVWSAGVVGTADNILRPMLIGNDTKMPDLLILVSTFGGLAMFGAAGLIVGPIIAGVTITMWEEFEETFGRLDSSHEEEDGTGVD